MLSTMPEAKKGNVRLTGYVDIPDARYVAVMTALAKHVELTRAEAGCVYFSVEPSPNDVNKLQVNEIFEDRAAFDFHQRRASASVWAEITKGIERHFKVEDI